MLARIVTALIWLLTFVAMAVSAESSALAKASDMPNIIFILADDLGFPANASHAAESVGGETSD